MMNFEYSPSQWVPFRDKAVLEKARKLTRDQLTKHPNPDFKIRIIKDSEVEFIWVTDIFYRIKKAVDAGEKIVFILPNPCPCYQKVAYLINKFRLDCKNLYAFAMDEYANEDGVIAPESWRLGFMYAMMDNFYSKIDEDLRPPKNQFVAPNNKNLNDYGKMIADLGGADACYSGPGWTGHVAFVEPDAPEFDAPLEEWKKMGPRIVTLSPFTLAQNSLHGSLGMSGDIAAVPPKAATIGPAEVIGAKYRMDIQALTIHGTMTT